MRTTLDIDDQVLDAARELARRQRRSLGVVISELARQALTAPPPATAVQEPPAFYGFRPLPAEDRLVTDEAVSRLREQEGI